MHKGNAGEVATAFDVEFVGPQTPNQGEMRMMKTMETFKKSALLMVSMVGLGLVAGCDWSSGGGVDSYSTNPDVVNTTVSGVYRSPNPGDPIVTDYRSQATSPGSTTDVTRAVRGESLGTGNGVKTVFSGKFRQSDLVAGSVLITGAGYSFTDDGSGNLVGSPGGSGSITYSTGAWSVDFGGFAPAPGAQLTGNYEYNTTEVSKGSSVKSGASSTTIFSFNVTQVGNRITIVDNNGDRYEGQLTSTQVIDQQSVSEEQQNVRKAVQFEAEGISRGVAVRIVGVFNVQEVIFFSQEFVANDEELAVTTEEFARIISLTMDGTWIEPNAAGDVGAIGPQNQRVEVTSTIF